MSYRAKKNYSKMMPRSRTIYNKLSRDWATFKDVCTNRWAKIRPSLMFDSFEKKHVLGSGYFGVVLETTNKKLVVKVTSDRDEGYFNRLILSDDALRYNPGLPYILDCFYIREWDAFVILRENIIYGVSDLPESSPLMRAIPILDTYGDRVLKVESDAAKLVQTHANMHKNTIGRGMFEGVLREMQGEVRMEIIRTLKLLPNTSETSRYFYVMDVIRQSLEKYGIALWDLHSLNLGKHKHDMTEFDDNVFALDSKCLLISDVGGNFGSPILDDIIESMEI